jgi:hypothetical protein
MIGLHAVDTELGVRDADHADRLGRLRHGKEEGPGREQMGRKKLIPESSHQTARLGKALPRPPPDTI